MKKSNLILILLGLVLVVGCEKKVVEKPNILFIMTDDHTTQAMSCAMEVS